MDATDSLVTPASADVKPLGISKKQKNVGLKVGIGILVFLLVLGIAGFVGYRLGWFSKKAEPVPFDTVTVEDKTHGHGNLEFSPGDELQLMYGRKDHAVDYQGQVRWELDVDGKRTELKTGHHGNSLTYTLPDTLFSQSVSFYVTALSEPLTSVRSRVFSVHPHLKVSGGVGTLPNQVVFTSLATQSALQVSIEGLTGLNTSDAWHVELSTDRENFTGAVVATVKSVSWPNITWETKQVITKAYVRFTTTKLKSLGRPFELSVTSTESFSVLSHEPQPVADFKITGLHVLNHETNVGTSVVIPGQRYKLRMTFDGPYSGATRFTADVADLQGLDAVTLETLTSSAATFALTLTAPEFYHQWALTATSSSEVFTLKNLVFSPVLTWNYPTLGALVKRFPATAPSTHQLKSIVVIHGGGAQKYTWSVCASNSTAPPASATWWPATVEAHRDEEWVLRWYLTYDLAKPVQEKYWVIRAVHPNGFVVSGHMEVTMFNQAWTVPIAAINPAYPYPGSPSSCWLGVEANAFKGKDIVDIQCASTVPRTAPRWFRIGTDTVGLWEAKNMPNAVTKQYTPKIWTGVEFDENQVMVGLSQVNTNDLPEDWFEHKEYSSGQYQGTTSFSQKSNAWPMYYELHKNPTLAYPIFLNPVKKLNGKTGCFLLDNRYYNCDKFLWEI